MRNIIKGVIYGVFSICPGLSGGMLALKLGDYYRIISIINNKKYSKKEIFYLSSILIGFIIGSILFSNLINYLYIKYYTFFNIFVLLVTIYLVTNFAFKSKITNVELVFLLILSIFIGLFMCNLKLPNINLIILFIISGFIFSFSKVIPGFSGTSIFINIGFYKYLLNFFSNPLIFFNNIFLWSLFMLIFLISTILLIKFVSIQDKFFEYCVIVIMLVNIFMMLIK